uniref:Eukaryotic translation initiation factor 3 subunit G n=1 Tax=Acrobeloides nanus TaxID=290746 RepID=A0A914EK90_9BILA
MSNIEMTTSTTEDKDKPSTIVASDSSTTLANILENYSDTGPISWVEEIDREETSLRREFIKDGIKTVFDVIDDKDAGGKCEVITTFKIITKKVPKAIAERKKWTKFGESKSDESGPNISTTYVAEEVGLEFLPSAMLESDLQRRENKEASMTKKPFMVCRTCKSEDHRTVYCPYKEDYEKLEEFERNLEKTPLEEGTLKEEEKLVKSEIYLPPVKRDGNMAYSSLQKIRDKQREKQDECTLRVTNLPSQFSEEELLELFSGGKREIIDRHFMPYDDPVKMQPKGFAFITYKERKYAEEALKKLNGKRMNFVVLSVDWSKPNP